MSLATRQITALERPVRTGCSGGEPLPRDRVTLTAEALAANGGAGAVPQGDVRWYRPRGDAARQDAVTLLGWAVAGGLAEAPAERPHRAVQSYLRVMRLLA